MNDMQTKAFDIDNHNDQYNHENAGHTEMLSIGLAG